MQMANGSEVNQRKKILIIFIFEYTNLHKIAMSKKRNSDSSEFRFVIN